MPVNSVNSTNTTNNTDTTTSVEAYKKEYEALNKTWTDEYSTNAYLSSEFKGKMADMLAKLENLVDVSEEEKKNEEIAELIAGLKAIINGSDSMISLADRVKCLEELDTFKKSTKSKDLSEDECNSINNVLNNIELSYPDKTSFYYALYSSILDNYSNRIDQNTKNTIQNLIDRGIDNTNSFYSQFMSIVLDSNKNNLYSKDHTNLSSTTYDTIADFFNALSPALMNYSVYQTEQDNISSASRASLSNQTLSMKVMQESNAYKLLEIDNLMSEELNKRAEMDPAMKRLRDGIYWADNKEVKAQDSIKPEDELWIKKQE